MLRVKIYSRFNHLNQIKTAPAAASTIKIVAITPPTIAEELLFFDVVVVILLEESGWESGISDRQKLKHSKQVKYYKNKKETQNAGKKHRTSD